MLKTHTWLMLKYPQLSFHLFNSSLAKMTIWSWLFSLSRFNKSLFFFTILWFYWNFLIVSLAWGPSNILFFLSVLLPPIRDVGVAVTQYCERWRIVSLRLSYIYSWRGFLITLNMPSYIVLIIIAMLKS